MKKKSIISLLVAVLVLASLASFAFAEGEASVVADAANGEPLPWYAGLLGSPIPMIIVMVLVFYFFLIRPENKRKKEAANMRDSLKNGDEITTIGGIIGKITKVKDDVITIETTTEKNKIKIAKWAVSSVNKKSEKAENPENANDEE